MTDAELIERLRSMSCYDYAATREAADRLAALQAENGKLVGALGSLIKYCEDHNWGTIPEPGEILDRAVVASPALSYWYTPLAVREAGKCVDIDTTLTARVSGDIADDEILIMEQAK